MNKNALFWGKQVLKTKRQKTEQKTTKTNKEGLGSGEVARRATSPDPKTKKKQKNKKIENPKNSKHTKKRVFQLSVNFFLGGFFFLTPWPQKRSPPKHYKNRGSRPFLWGKADVRHKTAIFGQKPKFINFIYHFLLPIFFSFNNKKTQICRNPYFYSALANLKKRIFKKLT